MIDPRNFGASQPGSDAIAPLIGESMAMRALRKAAGKVADVNAPVLITGETGTGKELVARYIHTQSRRADGPFVAVNCAALPAELFQAEVFGYVKGAFTGAYRDHAGRIEAALGGTLFLDEIGDLSLETQATLLRFLDDGVFERLGSTRPVRADVRVVAATNADLEKACRKGKFREDLFHRLNNLRLRTPPLRERPDDIGPLSQHFLTKFTRELGLSSHAFDHGVLDCMSEYRWPGNVRELQNRIRQALVMSEEGMLTAYDLGLDGDAALDGSANRLPPSLRDAREAAERQAIQQVLYQTAGNIEHAAHRLCISRAQLYRLLRQYRINSAAVRKQPDDGGNRSHPPNSSEDRRRIPDRRSSER